MLNAFEFTINNSGKVDKYQVKKGFFLSSDNPSYHKISESTRTIYILLDFVYWIGLIWLVYKSCRRIYSIVYTKIKYKVLTIYSPDVVDFLVVSLSVI